MMGGDEGDIGDLDCISDDGESTISNDTLLSSAQPSIVNIPLTASPLVNVEVTMHPVSMIAIVEIWFVCFFIASSRVAQGMLIHPQLDTSAPLPEFTYREERET